MYSARYPCQILMRVEFSRQIFEKYSNINFMKIRPVETESSHTDGHEAYSRFSQFYERTLQTGRRDLCMYPPPLLNFPTTYIFSTDVLDTGVKGVTLSAPAELTTFNHSGETVS
jgi:hypothetical protein